jgi:hypothetical protein
MNTMNMPGFTAEVSLYNATVCFPKARTFDELTNGPKIIPQRVPLCEVEAGCLSRCQLAGYRDCWHICCH